MQCNFVPPSIRRKSLHPLDLRGTSDLLWTIECGRGKLKSSEPGSQETLNNSFLTCGILLPPYKVSELVQNQPHQARFLSYSSSHIQTTGLRIKLVVVILSFYVMGLFAL